MLSQIYLHIGTHKTGTTAVQHYLSGRVDCLRTYGIEFFRGEFIHNNHVELHVAAMQERRRSPFKDENSIFDISQIRVAATARVQEFIQKSRGSAIFSAEGLSYVRFEDEIDFLADHRFPPDITQVILYIRSPLSFLQSYKAQISRYGAGPSSEEKDSYRYCGEDSWLVDYDSLIAAYSRRYRVETINYEMTLSQDRSVIPSFLRIIGIEPDLEDPDIFAFVNVSERL